MHGGSQMRSGGALRSERRALDLACIVRRVRRASWRVASGTWRVAGGAWSEARGARSEARGVWRKTRQSARTALEESPDGVGAGVVGRAEELKRQPRSDVELWEDEPVSGRVVLRW